MITKHPIQGPVLPIRTPALAHLGPNISPYIISGPKKGPLGPLDHVCNIVFAGFMGIFVNKVVKNGSRIVFVASSQDVRLLE